MATLLRKLRGMVGIGALWAAVWAPLGLGIATAQLLSSGFGLPPADLVLALLVSGLQNGFAAGFLFSGGLGLVYRHRSFDDIRLGAAGAVGAVAGILVPAGSIAVMAMSGFALIQAWSVFTALAFGGAVGAATAIGSLKVAQAAPETLPPGREAPKALPTHES